MAISAVTTYNQFEGLMLSTANRQWDDPAAGMGANVIASGDGAPIATASLAEFSSFDITNPVFEATLIGLLDGLITGIVEFTAVHKANILAMGATMDSKEDVLGFVGVTLGDVQRART